MGFAVVADEVRNLARRSADSAKETATKIEDAVQRSEHGARISGQVALSLAQIVEKAHRVDVLVAEIATASQEQSQGIGQVNVAITQFDKVTQSNASNAEETAAASEELSAQAMTMRENVTDLMRLVDGADVDPDSSPEKVDLPHSRSEPRLRSPVAPRRTKTPPSSDAAFAITKPLARNAAAISAREEQVEHELNFR
jgi:methyl-accepting chemotaxis protein